MLAIIGGQVTNLYQDRNRQARRSIKALQNALLDLLKEKPYNKITITEISERSGLTRSTFYAHFNTKEDLLVSYVDNILDQFFTNLDKRNFENPDIEQDVNINISLFEIWQERSEIARLINVTDNEKLFIQRFMQYWRKIYEARVEEMRPDVSQALSSYLISFLAYAVYGVLNQWMENGMSQSPEDMGQLLYSLTGPPVIAQLFNQFKDMI